MNKKYLMKGMAALALIASVSSCVSDVEGISQADIDAAAKENAELQLGITIPEGQTWSMAAKVTTDITVNLGVDQNYTVGIYNADPRFSKSVFYAKENVQEGGRLTTSVTLPNAMKTAYIAVYDSNYELQTVKVASVVDGEIRTNVGGVDSRRAMRAAPAEWSHNHSDDWMEYLNFEKPTSGYTEVKNGVQLEGSGTYYVPSSFTGTLSFKDNFAGKVYIDAKLTGFSGNNLGNVSIYILKNGSWTLDGITTGNITIYNQGSLILGSWAWQNQNIKTVYNGGYVKIGKKGEYPGFADGVSLYSNGTGIVDIEGVNTDLKLACDIHGTMNVTGDLKIQNGRTQYICGLVVSGTLDMTQGKLETSYIHATDIKFDGSHIWLLPEAHVVATNQISMPNSGSEIYGYEESYALIETQNFYLRNHNNFIDTFSENIQFKITGWIDIQERITQSNGQVDDKSNKYNSAADYIRSQNGSALANRMNQGVYGISECSDAYGTPEKHPEEQAVYTYAFEDQKVAGDYDMNDVVLKICHPYNEDGLTLNTSKLEVKLVAAGATFDIKVKIGDTYLFNGKEIHEALKVNSGVMVNTGAHSKVQNGVTPISDTVDAPAGWDGDFENLDVKIEVVTLNDEVIAFLTEKVVPYAVMIPHDWEWPIERINVMKAYKGFEVWAKTPVEERKPAMNLWYENPVEGNVVTNLSNNQ